MFFATIQCSCLGSTANWLNVFTTKQMSDMVLTKYINEPINHQYIDGSINMDSEPLNFLKLVTMGVAMDL